jgi:uncharacterized protein YmfQ (DUF2313 family)
MADKMTLKTCSLQKRFFLLFAEEEGHYHLNVTVSRKGEKCVSLKAIGTSLNF